MPERLGVGVVGLPVAVLRAGRDAAGDPQLDGDVQLDELRVPQGGRRAGLGIVEISAGEEQRVQGTLKTIYTAAPGRFSKRSSMMLYSPQPKDHFFFIFRERSWPGRCRDLTIGSGSVMYTVILDSIHLLQFLGFRK